MAESIKRERPPTLTTDDRRGLLLLAKELANVTEACRQYHCSRDTYYRLLKRFQEYGEAGLDDSDPSRTANNRLSSEIEKIVISYSAKRPGYGRERIAHNLRKQGIDISPGAVRKIWLRHGLPTNRRPAPMEGPPMPPPAEQQTPTVLHFGSYRLHGAAENPVIIDCKILIDKESRFVHFRSVVPGAASESTSEDAQWISSVEHFYEFLSQEKPRIDSPGEASLTSNFWRILEREHQPFTSRSATLIPLEHQLTQLEGWIYYYNYERISQTINGTAFTPWELLIARSCPKQT